MPITLRGETLYSASEVSAMTPTGTVDSQWETHFLSGKNGWDDAQYKLHKFHVNKITGLVTGEIGISNRTATAPTSVNYGTNANLGIHPDMVIKYPGTFEYAITKNTAAAPLPAANENAVREINTAISTTGDFALQGRSWTAATCGAYLQEYLETFAYIGSKYGKIYTQEYNPIYLQEGAFYRKEQVDLITGHAWLKINVPLPAGYASNSFLYGYKNLWSGEVILQYSLHPSTAGSMPAITLPARLAVYGGRRFYTDIRYCDPATTYGSRHTCWMNVSNTTVSFNPIPSQAWATGSLFYQGNEETSPHGNGQETVVGLWLPESAQPIPSVNNAKFPRAKANSYQCEVLDGYIPTSKFAPRSSDPSWATNNYRTGMVFFYWDLNMKAGTIPSPFATTNFSAAWIPSYRYNITAGEPIRLYCNGVQYLSNYRATPNKSSDWTMNIAINSGKSAGVAGTGTTDRCFGWGTTGEATEAAGLACFNGYYLGNYPGNIVQ